METVKASAELVSAERYLHSSFERDAEFVGGRLVPRPMPTWEHASMQGFREYLHFGIAWVWVIDTVSLTGQVHSQGRVKSVEDPIFSTDRFNIDLPKRGFDVLRHRYQ
jgi:hypothetical protein